ncbi:MAG: metallophosphoesterase [Clostridia bacterium]|nr:metallophosphoesterase [Clostridia bacterium]
MALFTLADTHLSLKIEKPMDIFGSRWRGHDEKITAEWNRVVSPDDTVVVGGDISWGISLEESGDDLLFLDRLNGNKILLRGNHDYWWNTPKKVTDFFEASGITSIKLLQNNSYVYDTIAICGTRGWYSDSANAPETSDYQKIVARETARLKLSLDSVKDPALEKVVFMHFPPKFENYVCRPLIDLMKEYGIKRCYYGHIHGIYALAPMTVFEGIEFHIVSADFLNFTPKEVPILTTLSEF